MNDPAIITAYFAGLAALLTAGTAAYVAIRGAQKKAVVQQEQIHKVVNSNYQDMVTKLAAMQDRLDAVAQTGKDPGRKRTRRT